MMKLGIALVALVIGVVIGVVGAGVTGMYDYGADERSEAQTVIKVVSVPTQCHCAEPRAVDAQRFLPLHY